MRLGRIQEATHGLSLAVQLDDGAWFTARDAVDHLPAPLGWGRYGPLLRDMTLLAKFGAEGWRLVTDLADAVARYAPDIVRPAHRLGDARWEVPLDPPKIIGIGHNYRDLLAAGAIPVPAQPKLFAKWPTALVAHQGCVRLPQGLREVSYEAELAVILGRGGRAIAEDEALSAVFGYAIANDVTATDAIRDDGGELVRGKNYDTFLPLGPWVTRAQDVTDPQGLRVRLDQNGVRRQDSSTDQMVFGVARLVSFVSHVMTLQPGDVILTGSPAGVARFHAPPAYLAPGDRIVITIDGLGTLAHGVADAG